MITQIQEEGHYSIHPKLFNLILLIVGICMLFAGLTSAYIVRMGEGNWLHFKLPNAFVFSTIIVVISSITMLWAIKSAKNDNIESLKIALLCTLVLGIAFCYFQFLGWNDMKNMGLFFSNNIEQEKISGSFIIALGGIHLAHILAGIIFVFIVLIKAFMNKIHKKNLLSIKMCNIYWHFVGILWVYLFLFFYFAN